MITSTSVCGAEWRRDAHMRHVRVYMYNMCVCVCLAPSPSLHLCILTIQKWENSHSDCILTEHRFTITLSKRSLYASISIRGLPTQYDTFKVIWSGAHRIARPMSNYKSKVVVKIGDFSRLRPFSHYIYFSRLCFYTIGIPHTREWIQGIAASSQHHENMPMEDISNISPVQQREKDIYIVRKCEDRSIPRVQLP